MARELKNNFDYLRAFLKGKISEYELKHEIINFISRVEKKTPILDTEITLEFENDYEFFELFGVSNYTMNRLSSIFSHYSSYNVIDYSSTESDFDEGYGLWYNLDSENHKKIQLIANFLLPNHEGDTSDLLYREYLAKALRDNFPRYVEKMIDSYHSYKEGAIEEALRDLYLEFFTDELHGLGYSFVSRFTKIKTTLKHIFELYTKQNNSNLSLYNLVKNDIKENAGDIDSVEDSIYDNEQPIDEESFNYDVSSYLDEILEKISEDESYSKKLSLLDELSKKFTINKKYRIPKLPENYTFKIVDVDKEDLKIVVFIQKDIEFKKIKLTLDGFYKLLYQPELFSFDDIFL